MNVVVAGRVCTSSDTTTVVAGGCVVEEACAPPDWFWAATLLATADVNDQGYCNAIPHTNTPPCDDPRRTNVTR